MSWRAPVPRRRGSAIEGLFRRNDALLEVEVFGAFGGCEGPQPSKSAANGVAGVRLLVFMHRGRLCGDAV
jgi:hypothetical protein